VRGVSVEVGLACARQGLEVVQIHARHGSPQGVNRRAFTLRLDQEPAGDQHGDLPPISPAIEQFSGWSSALGGD